ncbi:MAG TPA: hypothetical protein VGA78_10175 [Gemmatimonadales bacterium]|jgi:hypothetical protein
MAPHISPAVKPRYLAAAVPEDALPDRKMAFIRAWIADLPAGRQEGFGFYRGSGSAPRSPNRG